MPLTPQITFRNLDSSESVRELIADRAAELEQFFDRIVACKVVVESSSHRQRQGRLFHVAVHLSLPGSEIVVKRDPAEHHAHEDIRVAVRDAFDATRRQLEDYVRRLRGQVKQHEPQETARVARLFAERDYGFLLTPSGEEIYMHRNSVVNGGFDKLRAGDEVRFVSHPGEGDAGPQASTVVPLKSSPR
jgi:ribosomal subunit interface protein